MLCSALPHGIKFVEHNATNIKATLSARFKRKYPWTLEALFDWPDFHGVALTIQFHALERAVYRGKSRQALERFAQHNLMSHPRINSIEITDPSGRTETLQLSKSVH